MLGFDELSKSVCVMGDTQAAGFKSTVPLVPVIPTDKVFPATYSQDKKAKQKQPNPYAIEKRHFGAETKECVQLDSIQAQANELEAALLDAIADNRITGLSYLAVDVSAVQSLIGRTIIPGRITTFEMNHRSADAYLRVSGTGNEFKNIPFVKEMALTTALDATTVLQHDPISLLNGYWFARGGALGARMKRSHLSSIWGVDCILGQSTGGRCDPFLINGAEVYEAKAGGYTLDPKEALDPKKPKKHELSQTGLGMIPPGRRDNCGASISYALQQAWINLRHIRELRFPVGKQKTISPEANVAGRTFLVAMALCGHSLMRSKGYSLRSYCDLVVKAGSPNDPRWQWTTVNENGSETQFTITPADSISLLNECIERMKSAGIPQADPTILRSGKFLNELFEHNAAVADSILGNSLKDKDSGDEEEDQ